MISVADARSVIRIVAADKASRRKISSWLDSVLPDTLGWAGGIRNAVMEMPRDLASTALEVVGLKHPTDVWEQFECNSIAHATSRAIRRAIDTGRPEVRNVLSVATVGRDVSLGNAYEHTGTKVTVRPNTTVVFDWHATLAENNPMIYPDVRSFHLGVGGKTFEELEEASGWSA